MNEIHPENKNASAYKILKYIFEDLEERKMFSFPKDQKELIILEIGCFLPLTLYEYGLLMGIRLPRSEGKIEGLMPSKWTKAFSFASAFAERVNMDTLNRIIEILELTFGLYLTYPEFRELLSQNKKFVE